jgi:hypothetical protein
MSNNMVTPSDFFNPDTQAAHLALIACPGAEVLTRGEYDLVLFVQDAFAMEYIIVRCA